MKLTCDHGSGSVAALKPYPAYKPSGVEWLGEVPAHWDVRRLKTGVYNVVNLTSDRRDEEIYLALEHVESWTGRVRSAEPDISFDSQVKQFAPGDVLFGKLRPYLAKVAHPHRSGVCVGEFLVLRPRTSGLDSAYLARFLRSRQTIDAINASTFGAKMPRAEWGFIGSLACPLPPLSEQAAIARYLNHADRRIRRCIQAKEKLVELLEEQRQALINEAVTGRVDVRTGQPYPEYKPSGVEWLGEVPAHWRIARNGRIFVQRNETGFPELPILEVSLNTGISVRNLDNLDRKQMMTLRSEYKRAIAGDIAYNMMRMWQGAVGVTPVDGLVSPAYVVARPLDGTSPRYFSALFRTSAYTTAVDRSSRGIVKDRNRLYWSDFKQMASPYPPIEEQATIARYLDDTDKHIQRGIHAAQRQIELLNEYQTRLTSDVVTGKLDVRDAAAALSERDTLSTESAGDSSTETQTTGHRRASRSTVRLG